MTTEIEHPPENKKSGMAKKAGVFLVVGAIILVAYTQYGDQLSLQNLAKQETELRTFQADHPVFVYGARHHASRRS